MIVADESFLSSIGRGRILLSRLNSVYCCRACGKYFGGRRCRHCDDVGTVCRNRHGNRHSLACVPCVWWYQQSVGSAIAITALLLGAAGCWRVYDVSCVVIGRHNVAISMRIPAIDNLISSICLAMESSFW